MERKEAQSDEIDLLQLVLPLLKKWKILFLFMVIGGVAAFIATSFMPKVYESKATIYIQQSSQSGLLKSLPVSVPGMAGSDSGYYTTLLQSDAMQRKVIRQLNLQTNRGFTKKPDKSEDDTIEKFRKKFNVTEQKTGGVVISMQAYDPQLAADIVNAVLDNLESLVLTASKKKKIFISERLDQTKKDLDSAEVEMARFMKKANLAEIDEQTKASIEQLGQMESQLLDIDSQLEGLSSQLKNEGNLDNLVNTEVKRNSLLASKDYLVKQRDDLRKKLSNLPEVGLEYARLQRQVTVLSKTFELLTEQYQLASITQKGEDGDYQIIDRARPNPKHVAPRRSVNSALGGILAVIIASVVILANASRAERKLDS